MSSASTGTDGPSGPGRDLDPGPDLDPERSDRRTAVRWRDARVADVVRRGEHAVVVRLDVPDKVRHVPGQHYVVRLRAEDGYTASRSYSVASSPSDPLVELWVDRVPDGEVSSHLGEVLEPGDVLEVRGPVGRWFVWAGDGPAVGFGGGSGVAPLVAMLRHARDLGRPELLHLAVTARTRDLLPYADELEAAGALVALTRGPDPRRLDAATVAALADPGATALVCGSTRFTSAVEDHLRDAGQPASSIRVERFGPTS